jgi:hypothetical protein
MEHTKFVKMRDEISRARGRAQIRSPFFWMGLLMFLVLVGAGFSYMIGSPQQYSQLNTLVLSPKFTNNLMLNYTLLVNEVVSLQAQNLAIGYFIRIILGLLVVIAGFVIFWVYAECIYAAKARRYRYIVNYLHARGYTDKDIDEYNKTREEGY